MNERIKQLAEQCESFGSWDNKTYSFDKEKFAELIVKECSQISKDHQRIYYESHGDRIAKKIQKHFGVEE
jgi:hypothetical protein